MDPAGVCTRIVQRPPFVDICRSHRYSTAFELLSGKSNPSTPNPNPSKPSKPKCYMPKSETLKPTCLNPGTLNA